MDTPKSWHSTPKVDVLAALHTIASGLSEDVAAERLRADGPNRLPEAEPLGSGWHAAAR